MACHTKTISACPQGLGYMATQSLTFSILSWFALVTLSQGLP